MQPLKGISNTAIGFRVTPSATYYTVVTNENGVFRIVSADKIKCPKALEPPGQLKHIRQTIFDLIKEFAAGFGGIKLIENNSRTRDAFRLNVEGVIQEAFASSALTHFFFGTIPQLTGVFGINDKKKINAIIAGEESFDRVDMKEFGPEHREGILAAVAAILGHGH